MPPIPGTQPTQPTSRARTLPLVGLGLAGVLFLGGYVICGDRASSSPPTPQAQSSPVEDRLAGLRPVTSGRVPKLRAVRPERPPALTRAGGPSAPSSDPRERLAPLITMYGDFFEAVGLEATEMRELRRLIYQAHQWVLRPGSTVGNNPSAKREQALALFQKQLNDTLRPDQAERVMAHPFVQELLGWNEPFFEADARGLVSVRNDVMPREAKGASYVPESTE